MATEVGGRDINDSLQFGLSTENVVLVGRGGSDIMVTGSGNDTLIGDGTLVFGATPAVVNALDLAGNRLVNGLGGPAGFGEHVLPAGAAASVPVDITPVFGPQGLHIFGQFFTTVYVNQFGGITLGAPFTGDPATLGVGDPVIAPYWSKVDTSAGAPPADASALQSGNSMGTNRVYYDLDAQNGIFTVTWDDVGNAPNQGDPQFSTNAFQLQLIDTGRVVPGSQGNFEVVFRYEDITWRFGIDDPLGAQIGYYSGAPSDSPFLFEQPSDAAAIPDTITNDGVPGVHTLSVVSGSVTTPTPPSPSGLGYGVWFGPFWYGNDFLTGGRGDDLLVGGGGVDVASFHGLSSAYTITNNGDHYSVSGPDGNDSVYTMERLRFDDVRVSLDLADDQAGGMTVRLIGAAFGPEAVGERADYVGVGLRLLDSGMSMPALAELVAQAPEFTFLVGGADSDTDFVTTVYQNVTGVSASDADVAFYAGLLEGGMSRGELLMLAANSQANAQHIDIVGLQQTGVDYIGYTDPLPQILGF